ncbi:MAG: bacteriohemerythrin [Rhodocyclaceae bacterium]|jgi:hemerythrin-like metal-binding protein|nr:bacteriohemerythrin [Rhodocyclaceae bacterium]
MDERPQFDSRFLVGIEQVDLEHRQLFEIAGRVYDGLAAGNDALIAATRAAIAELLDYTATHFASEEALMEAAGYPGLEAHRALHRHLLRQARDMEMRAESGEQYVPVELSHFIYNWLVDHILANDRKFGEFVTAQKK